MLYPTASSRIPDEDVRELAKRVCRARPTGINGSWMNRARARRWFQLSSERRRRTLRPRTVGTIATEQRAREYRHGSNYRVADEPGTEIADGSNYRDEGSLLAEAAVRVLQLLCGDYRTCHAR